MAVAVNIKFLTEEVREKIHDGLRVKGKKNGQHKARVPEITAYNFERDTSNYVIPLQYARNMFNVQSVLKTAEFKMKAVSFRNDKFCQQEPVYKEAIGKLKTSYSVFLQLHCGWGKTFMAIVLAASLGMKTIVLVHRRFLASQFLEEASKIIPNQAHFIDDNEMDFDPTLPLYICTERRAFKLPTNFKNSFGLVIVDEAKYWCTPERVKAMLEFRPTHTMGLCAERERRDGYHVFLDFFFGHNIFRKSCKPFTVWKYFTTYQPEIKRPEGFSKAKIDWTHAMRSLERDEDRNIMIRDLCRVFGNNKIIIFLSFKTHVETMYDLLVAAGVKAAKFYDNMDTFTNCRVLVTTYSKAEMGFDDKNLCENFDGERFDMVILGIFYKKEIEQTVGRVFRADAPTVIDIVDDYPGLHKHSKVRDTWFKSHCGEIKPTEYLW